MKYIAGLSAFISVVVALFGGGLARAQVQGPTYIPGSTAKVLQLTGDFDRQLQQPTRNLTGSRYGIWFVDLGYGFEHKGRLYFLHGDVSASGSRQYRDPIAHTSSTDPKEIDVCFPLDEDGLFHPVTIPGVSYGEFEGFGGAGVSINDAMYIVFATDHSEEEVMGRSVLAKSVDDGITFSNVYELSNRKQDGKFISVAMWSVGASEVAGLPVTGDAVLIWGTGKYRQSDPYLACAPAGGLEDKSALRYYTGMDEAGNPSWSDRESDAAPLFHHPVMGEFSVVWYERVQRWLMLYGSLEPRGIMFRHATTPWEWSDMQRIYEPATDGYGKFVHSLADPLPNGISLSDPGRENEWGGEYCPAMLARYFTATGTRHTIYFNMSTWNPYEVVLMRADIRFPSRVAAVPDPASLKAGDRVQLTIAGPAAAPFQWHKDGIPLDDDPPRLSGTRTAALVIERVEPADNGVYYAACGDGAGSSEETASLAINVEGEIPAAESVPTYVPGSTERVLQLTGDFDRPLLKPTRNLTGSRFGVWGTDLGYPVEHKDRLYLLFGDTPMPGRRSNRDPIAYTTSKDPQSLALDFVVDEDGRYRPIEIPGTSHDKMEVPAGNGISLRDVMYIVFTTDHSAREPMGRSVLAKSDDDGATFSYIYDLSNRRENGKFIGVAMAETPPPATPGLPTQGNTVLIWGSGKYRQSDPYLACVPSDSIEDKSALRYYAGTSESGQPVWSELESDAAPLFHHPVMGEFSVVWYEKVQRWLMLYGSIEPRGVMFRWAARPWEWSDMQRIVDPATDGYGKFMHSLADPLPNGMSLSDPGRENQWGGEYGPAMLARYFTGTGARHTIYFTMSTWNPYQVVLMRADIRFPPPDAAGPEPRHTEAQHHIEPASADGAASAPDH